MKRSQLFNGMFVLFLTFYGAWRFYYDYLASPIRIACEYLDGMGAAFWVCLALAALIVVGVSVKKRPPL
jgi:prolipoprotein diacylglyceryltransferase